MLTFALQLHMVASEDGLMLNTGIFLVRTSLWSLQTMFKVGYMHDNGTLSSHVACRSLVVNETQRTKNTKNNMVANLRNEALRSTSGLVRYSTRPGHHACVSPQLEEVENVRSSICVCHVEM